MQMPNREGQTLADYQLTRILGRGGYAEVYLAEHISIRGVQVAIKVLKERELQDDQRDAFRNEARIMRSLGHEHIVKIHDYGIEMNKHGSDISTPYIIMEYAPLGTLRRHHPNGTRVPLEKIAVYVNQIAEALQFAHDHKPESIVHGDVKPENILLKREDFVVLSDFGIAIEGLNTGNVNVQKKKSIAERMLVPGTMAYTAPERLQGGIQRANDQYSLAIVTYEWLCGKRPFYGSTDDEIAQKHLYERPPSLTGIYSNISPQIEQVVMKGLEKLPQNRYASVSEFASALEQAIRLTMGVLNSNSFAQADAMTPLIGWSESPPTSIGSRPQSGPMQGPTMPTPDTPDAKTQRRKIPTGEQPTQGESTMRRSPSPPSWSMNAPPSAFDNQRMVPPTPNLYNSVPMSPSNANSGAAETQSASIPPYNRRSTSGFDHQQSASQQPNSPLGTPTIPSGNPSWSDVQGGGQGSQSPLSPSGPPPWSPPPGAGQPPPSNPYPNMSASTRMNQSNISTQFSPTSGGGSWNSASTLIPPSQDKRNWLTQGLNYTFATDSYVLKLPINKQFLLFGNVLNVLSAFAIAFLVQPLWVGLPLAALGIVVMLVLLRLCALLLTKFLVYPFAFVIALWWGFVGSNIVSWLPDRDIPIYGAQYPNFPIYGALLFFVCSLLIHIWYINNRHGH